MSAFGAVTRERLKTAPVPLVIAHEEIEEMATYPGSAQPDRINPQSPPETPPLAPPGEAPGNEPPEIEPLDPGENEPAIGPEIPPASSSDTAAV